MGANISKKELQLLTPAAIAEGVRSWGVAYEVYCKDIIENGINGEVLLSMNDASEVIDTFQITNRFQIAKIRSVLTTIWKQETDESHKTEKELETSIDDGPNPHIEVCNNLHIIRRIKS